MLLFKYYHYRGQDCVSITTLTLRLVGTSTTNGEHSYFLRLIQLNIKLNSLFCLLITYTFDYKRLFGCTCRHFIIIVIIITLIF